ncbi:MULTISPECIES: hypothetical protein [Rhizobium]|uniref:Uncharacterized protein n=1 Tax=Rhizobium rhododendri TaxID=2506430 RepID=A0ABY8IL90_9HYPH|nr:MULTISPECIES: hypothetical protein [Rhizobium]MBZ5758365.1 hypothetical protein [Rhizobium sp. VS19-DR96]MBZ5764805.1 hypothetical protein [Rhizobium sp. VS19-DR129.2]MBZ5772348.1 hypothetical protein [Rhizobium sp. VS19-DRK62.2]MBZ5782965.1 hypothetical protein [Rhizobium sp. VS19-DR121]MBZ5800413.1 hypothetical protein [Rhizobium sp. VS19-DR181]
MIFNFFNARKRAASIEVDAIDFSREEALHPALEALVLAQEKQVNLSSHERDYGAKRAPIQMPVAFI